LRHKIEDIGIQIERTIRILYCLGDVKGAPAAAKPVLYTRCRRAQSSKGFESPYPPLAGNPERADLICAL